MAAKGTRRGFEEIIRELPQRIAVVGVGGAGGKVMSQLKRIPGVHFVAVDTNAVDLKMTRADEKILLGQRICMGQGCEGFPERGAKATNMSKEQIRKTLQDKGMILLISGLSGGTGTGGSPVIAELAQDLGIFVLTVVILPLSIEKVRRMRARKGLRRITESCDATLVVDNDKLRSFAGKLSLEQAFASANKMIGALLENLLETITIPSLVNLDLADLQSVLQRGAVSVIGVGHGRGDGRVEDAVHSALKTPLLDITGLESAYGCLIYVRGGEDLTLEDVNRAGEMVSSFFPNLTKVAWGIQISGNIGGVITVLIILSGMKSPFLQHFDSRMERVSFEVRRHLMRPIKGLYRRGKRITTR